MKLATIESYVLPRWLNGWERFWFAPADPTLLGLIRITCGLIVVYTLVAYSFSLDASMGENGWHNLDFRLETARERPVYNGPLDWTAAGRLPAPANEFEEEYAAYYRHRWGFSPHPPYPRNEKEVKDLDDFREKYNIDLRINGLRPWRTSFEQEYVERYTHDWNVPPPAYPPDGDWNEAKRIHKYMLKWYGVDPRRAYVKGLPIFSLFFHVTNPDAILAIHVLTILVGILFTLGFCTRITSAMIWFGSLSYIHRNPTVLFGVDTMTNITLLYLMIGPSGAAFSLDRLILRWWRGAKPGFVQAWSRFWGQPIPSLEQIAPVAFAETPSPSVSANVAIRLLQVHVCIIYLMAGLSKLLGRMWWDGSAIWYTVANYEFAPMQSELYMAFLRFVGTNQLLYDTFMSASGLFTLAFEIGYAFLIWRPKLRWVFLAAAIVLHGGIGLMMGLRSFSLMMLVMNMAFLKKEEALWLLGWLKGSNGIRATAPPGDR